MKKLFCYICNSKLSFSFLGKDCLYHVTNKQFKVYTCKKCNLKITEPFTNDKEMLRYYPMNYYSYNSNSRYSNLKLLKRNIIKNIYNKGPKLSIVKKVLFSIINLFNLEMYFGIPLKNNTGGRFLDIGCGDGEIVNIMSECGWDSYGFEIDNKYSYKNRIYKDTDFPKIHLINKFDCIRIWSVFEHVTNPLDYLIKIKSSLTNKGVVYMCFPNSSSFNAKLFKKYWFGLDIPRHQYHYNYNNINLLLKKMGFVIIKHAYWDNNFLNSLSYLIKSISGLNIKFPLLISLFISIFYSKDTLVLKLTKQT